MIKMQLELDGDDPGGPNDKDRPSRGDRARMVHQTLQREILTLRLKPGSLLDETQLAQRFGMSRSPIREALSRLSAQNLVEMLPNRSTLVAPLDLANFPRYVEALDLLQRINTRLAAEHRTEADLSEMTLKADQFDASIQSNDHLEMSATNKAFHMAVASAGGNPYLTQQYGVLLDQGRRLLHLHFDYLERSRGEYLLASEHHDMIEAIRDRDVLRAEQLAHDHTRQFHDRFMQFLSASRTSDFQLDPKEAGLKTIGAGNE